MQHLLKVRPWSLPTAVHLGTVKGVYRGTLLAKLFGKYRDGKHCISGTLTPSTSGKNVRTIYHGGVCVGRHLSFSVESNRRHWLMADQNCGDFSPAYCTCWQARLPQAWNADTLPVRTNAASQIYRESVEQNVDARCGTNYSFYKKKRIKTSHKSRHTTNVGNFDHALKLL